MPREFAPAEGADQEQEAQALLRWFSGIQSYVLRPSAFLGNLVREAKAQMNLPDRYLGVHIRRGHKWVETPAQPLEEYVRYLQELSVLTKTSNLLLVTEDQSVVDAMTKPRTGGMGDLGALPGLEAFHTFHTLNPRPSLRISIPQAIRLGYLSAASENEISLVNLMLLQQAQGFVGTFSSGYSKRALELLTARLEGVPPHVSLDHLWSP